MSIDAEDGAQEATARLATMRQAVYCALQAAGLGAGRFPLSIAGIVSYATRGCADWRTFPRVFRVWVRWLAVARNVKRFEASRVLASFVRMAIHAPEVFAQCEAYTAAALQKLATRKHFRWVEWGA